VANNPLACQDPSGLGFWSDLGDFLSSIFGGGGLPTVGPAVGGANGTVGWGDAIGINGGRNSAPWSEQSPLATAGLNGFAGLYSQAGTATWLAHDHP